MTIGRWMNAKPKATTAVSHSFWRHYAARSNPRHACKGMHHYGAQRLHQSVLTVVLLVSYLTCRVWETFSASCWVKALGIVCVQKGLPQ